MPDTSATGRWLVPLLFAGLAMGFTAAAWLTLAQLGVGMPQLGWPFSSLTSFALLSGVGGFVFGRAFQAQQRQRAAAREDPVEDDPNDKPVDENLPAMPLFENRVDLGRRRTQTVDGHSFNVFDLTTEVSDGDGGTVRISRTIALLTAAGLPSFELRPKQFQDRFLMWAGAVGLVFDESADGTRDGQEVVARFAATYRLTIASAEALISGTADANRDDEEAVRRVFTLPAMRAVLNRTDWRVQCHGGYLACWVAADALGPKRREKLVADAAALRTVLLAASAGEAGEPLATPPWVAPVQQQAARLQASLIGGVLGAFAGFFAAMLLQVGEVFGPENLPMLFPLTTACGVLLGATIGRLLPLRRPLLKKPQDERRERVVGCAMLVGLFGGFFAGGILGVVLGELSGLKIGDHRPRQLLFFGGIGAGVFLGPVILGVTTNFIYRWIAGLRGTHTQSESETNG